MHKLKTILLNKKHCNNNIWELGGSCIRIQNWIHSTLLLRIYYNTQEKFWYSKWKMCKIKSIFVMKMNLDEFQSFFRNTPKSEIGFGMHSLDMQIFFWMKYTFLTRYSSDEKSLHDKRKPNIYKFYLHFLCLLIYRYEASSRASMSD